MWSLMAACDVLVNLRYPTMGETSGSVIRALSLGKPLLVSDVGWFAELPDDVVLKVPVDELEVVTLGGGARVRGRARRRARRCRARLRRARARPRRVADAYVAALEVAAGGDAVDDAVLLADRRGCRRGRDRPTHVALAPRRRRGRDRSREPTRRAPSRRRWAWLGALVVGLDRGAVRARAPDGRPVDHGRRDRLLRAREELRGRRVVRRPRRADGGYGFVYPILISPAYALFARSRPSTRGQGDQRGAHVARPPCRRTCSPAGVVSQRGALVAAAAHRAVPSMFYTGTLMTENAFYPIFLLVALALVATARAADALARCVLPRRARRSRTRRARRRSRCFAAALVAPLLLGAARARTCARAARSLHAALRRPSADAVLASLADRRARPQPLVAARRLRARRPTRRTTSASRSRSGSLWHVAELDLYVGVVPFAALARALASTRGRCRAAERAFVAATVSLGRVCSPSRSPRSRRSRACCASRSATVLRRAARSSSCLVLWIERGMPRPRGAAASPRPRLVALAARRPVRAVHRHVAPTSDTFGVLPLVVAAAIWLHLPAHDIRWLVAGGAARSSSSPLLASPLRLLVGACRRSCFVLDLGRGRSRSTADRSRRRSARSSRGSRGPHRDWITAIVGSTTRAASPSLWTGATDRLTVNENEFFNRDVGPIYTTNGARPGGLAQTPVAVEPCRPGDYLAAGQRRARARRADRHEHLDRGAHDRRATRRRASCSCASTGRCAPQTHRERRSTTPTVGGAHRHCTARSSARAARLACDSAATRTSSGAPSSSTAYARRSRRGVELVGADRRGDAARCPLRARARHRAGSLPDPADARPRARSSRRAPTRASSGSRFLDFATAP